MVMPTMNDYASGSAESESGLGFHLATKAIAAAIFRSDKDIESSLKKTFDRESTKGRRMLPNIRIYRRILLLKFGI